MSEFAFFPICDQLTVVICTFSCVCQASSTGASRHALATASFESQSHVVAVGQTCPLGRLYGLLGGG